MPNNKGIPTQEERKGKKEEKVVVIKRINPPPSKSDTFARFKEGIAQQNKVLLKQRELKITVTNKEKTNKEVKIIKIEEKIYIADDGFVKNADFIEKRIKELEKFDIKGPNAVVLHRTMSSTAVSAFTSFKSGIGTHFLVDKDGTVYQTASLKKNTNHIGKIKSRCYETGTCSIEETSIIKKLGWNPTKIYNIEKVKEYPNRYPLNSDSVGIEVVAMYSENTKKWDDATPEQRESIAKMVSILKENYNLTNENIYEHDKISYKTEGEGANLY